MLVPLRTRDDVYGSTWNSMEYKVLKLSFNRRLTWQSAARMKPCKTSGHKAVGEGSRTKTLNPSFIL